MRQKMKHMAAALLALITVLAMGVVAFAAESTFSLRINTTSGHTYKIYQLATGTLSADESTLSDIEKGSSAKSNTTVENITALAGKTGAELGTAALALVDPSKSVETVTGNGKTIAVNNLKAGYYVVTDEYTDSAADHDGDTLSRAMVRLVKDTEITPKNTTVPSEKKINTGNVNKKAVDNEDVDYNTANVGDNVPYVVESVVPDMTDYTKFYFVLRDTLSAGLTYNGDMKVYIGETELEPDDYTVYTTASTKVNGGTYIEVVLKNFIQHKEKKGAKIDFIYSATVNKEAVVGNAGNPNTENIVFSSDPTTTPEGDKDNPDKPSGMTEENNPTGTTPTTTDEVKTYLTGIELLKIDATTGDALEGVVFSISGKGTKTTVHKEKRHVFEEDEKGTYWLLKNGTYTTETPNTEATTVWTCYDENGERISGTHEDGAHTSKCTYKTTKGNADDYVSTATKYSLHTYTEETTENTPVTVSATATTGSDGKITFTGLAAGKYTITELNTLDGYNLLTSPIELTIAFDGTALSGKFTYTSTGAVVQETPQNTEEGVVKLTVKNSKGTVLPSTGGIGTTIFYVVGSILVLAAAGLLIAGGKKESAK